MKQYLLTIITRNQNNPAKAEKLADLLKNHLGIQANPQIEKYNKFSNSYKILIYGEFAQDIDTITEAIKITGMIASPWLIYFDSTTQEVNMILNGDQKPSFRRQEFNVISWAQFQML